MESKSQVAAADTELPAEETERITGAVVVAVDVEDEE